jgi:hypothetical protein
MTSRWLQAQLTLVINLLTLKTVDIRSRFSPVFHYIYQWVKVEIIVLDPDDLDTRKSTGTSCQIEIHFMIKTTEYLL